MTLRQSIKRAFITLGAHRASRRLADTALEFAYLARYSEWCARMRPLAGDDLWQLRGDYALRLALYDRVAARERLAGTPIDYLEFGVAAGESLAWWLAANDHPASRFVGFDTFEGLPERWGTIPAGTFSTRGRPPDVSDPRCSFQIGLFQRTLPGFLETFRRAGRIVAHLDADLYSSTLFTLLQIGPRLRAGDILLFDEFNSVAHEFRGFADFCAVMTPRYELIGTANEFSQVALRILE
jgi:O-methyltransferase